MLQWNLYSKFASQLGGGDKLYNRDFPWYDSNKLDDLYKDKNTRRQALLFLFYLPTTTWDMEKQERVSGIEGAKVALEQAWKEHQKISELYPDGKIGKWNEDPRNFYYGWIVDRGADNLDGTYRLPNTVKQFVGISWQELHKIENYYSNEIWEHIKDYNGLDQYLTKNWKYWDLVKVIAGYERWNPKGYMEINSIGYLIPQTLQMFGYPTSFINQDYSPPGAIGYEWAVSLPDCIANKMKEDFNEKIVLGAGNLFGLYSCKDGLIKDGATQILVDIPYEDVRIYLMKKP
ncbi:MAG: hypothetical protein ACP5PQ_05640 [Thermoproteota archaeon]